MARAATASVPQPQHSRTQGAVASTWSWRLLMRSARQTRASRRGRATLWSTEVAEEVRRCLRALLVACSTSGRCGLLRKRWCCATRDAVYRPSRRQDRCESLMLRHMPPPGCACLRPRRPAVQSHRNGCRQTRPQTASSGSGALTRPPTRAAPTGQPPSPPPPTAPPALLTLRPRWRLRCSTVRAVPSPPPPTAPPALLTRRPRWRLRAARCAAPQHTVHQRARCALARRGLAGPSLHSRREWSP